MLNLHYYLPVSIACISINFNCCCAHNFLPDLLQQLNIGKFTSL